MADIQVTLGLDDKDYQSKIAADTKLADAFGSKAKAAFKEASDGFKTLSDHAETVRGKMESLGGVIAGIGLAEFVRHILESASATKDLSEAFGVSIATVKELEMAFSTAGRTSETVSKVMTTLAKSVDDVAAGSDTAIAAFSKLGVSINDLQTKDQKGILAQIAEHMIKAKGSAESLTAATTVLGKGVKGMPWGDFIDGLERANGKMDENAKAVEELDKVMKTMEKNARDIVNAFQTLARPVAEFFNEFTAGAGHAELAAKVLAGAMATFVAGGILIGVNSVIQAYTGLARALGLSSTATTVATATTAGYVAAATGSATASIIQAVGLGRVATAQMAVNVAQIELNTLMAVGEVDAIGLAAASTALAAAEGRLATMTEAAALAQLQLTTATTTGALAAGGAATATTAAGTAAIAGRAAVTGLSAALGPLAIAFGVAATAAMLFWHGNLNSNEEEELKRIHALQDALGTLTKTQLENYYKLSGADQKRVADMIIATAGAKAAQEALNKVMGSPTPDAPGKPATTPMLTTSPKDIHSGALLALKLQAEAQQLNNKLAADRLQTEIDLVDKSEEERKSKLAGFDAEAAAQKDDLRVKQDIARLEDSKKTAVGPGVAAIQSQIDFLKKQTGAYREQTGALGSLTDALVKKQNLAAMELMFAEQKLKVEKTLDDLTMEMDQMTMTNDEKKIDNINRQIKAEIALAIAKRQSQLGVGEVLSESEANAIKARIAGIYDPMKAKTEQSIAQSRDFSTGWNQAFNQYQEDATNMAKQGAETFNAMSTSVNQAIDKFVQTGEFSFSDLATSFAKMLLQMEMKALAAEASGWMKSLFSGGSSGGGGGGSILGAIGSLFGFAEGGQPPVGKASIVGENGPELFVPKTAGTIVPNNKLSGIGGGQTTNVTNVTNNHYTVNAVDAKSVAQLFAENRKQLLGTVRMAQAEQPYAARL